MSILLEKQFAVIGAGNIGRIPLDRLRHASVPPAQPVVSYAAAVPISLLAVFYQQHLLGTNSK